MAQNFIKKQSPQIYQKLLSQFLQKSLLRWHIALNLVPCSCAAEVEYSRILTLRTHRKTRHCHTPCPVAVSANTDASTGRKRTVIFPVDNSQLL